MYAQSSASLSAAFAFSSPSPGEFTRGKPFDSLQFLDCEIKQNCNQKHADDLRAISVSGTAYTKKTWLALRLRKAQSGEKRPSLPFTSARGKLDEHTSAFTACDNGWNNP